MTKSEARDIKPGLYTLWMREVYDTGTKIVPVLGVIGLFDNGDAFYCTHEKPWCGRFADTLRWTEPHWQCVDHVEPVPMEGMCIGGQDIDESFKVGGVVMLKSGGQKMTIEEVGTHGNEEISDLSVGDVAVTWMKEDGSIASREINKECLRRA